MAEVNDRCFSYCTAAMLVPIWMGANMAIQYTELHNRIKGNYNLRCLLSP